jgi:hypothetical protein
MDYENITVFIADYDCKWWVWSVLCTEEETDRLKIMFLHPNGPYHHKHNLQDWTSC